MATEHPLYNLTYLRQIGGGDDAFVNDMVQTFVRTSMEAVAEMEEYHQQQQGIKLKDAAHKFITTLTYVGVSELDERLRLIEQWAPAGTQAQRIAAEISFIKQHTLQVTNQLKKDFNL